MRLIDADELIRSIRKDSCEECRPSLACKHCEFAAMLRAIDAAPTVGDCAKGVRK